MFLFLRCEILLLPEDSFALALFTFMSVIYLSILALLSAKGAAAAEEGRRGRRQHFQVFENDCVDFLCRSSVHIIWQALFRGVSVVVIVF